jgi:hypothetical protein
MALQGPGPSPKNGGPGLKRSTPLQPHERRRPHMAVMSAHVDASPGATRGFQDANLDGKSPP